MAKKVTKKSTSKKGNATVAKKEAKQKAPKIAAVRPNRGHTGRSQFGDRKWIYQGVTALNKDGSIAATDPVNSMPLDKDTAEKVLAAALKRPDIANGRLFYKKPTEDGVQMRGVYVAFASDNGVEATA